MVRISWLKVLVACLAMLASVSCAFADTWWNPNESGWGVDVTQQGGVIFLTFFVYAQDNTPTWYIAVLPRGSPNAAGYYTYTGDVLATHGPWFGGAYNPGAVGGVTVGTATFDQSTDYSARLTYSVTGTSVTKTIERQTIQPVQLTGTYLGGYVVGASTCASTPAGVAGFIALTLNASTNADGTGTVQSGISLDQGVVGCTLAGTYRQHGSVFEVANGACATAAGQLNYSQITRGDSGVSGSATIAPGTGCRITLFYSAQTLGTLQ